ncbi:MAG: tripartite tricarboxylate transporter TctB family protein [Rhodobacteraceae bacterium]|nr:tripartite tricarboxylate transporter TctB family protein [Paracoccaceae bacterium]
MQDQTKTLSWRVGGRDITAGGIIALTGAASLLEATRYSFGRMSNIGPATFPTLASAMMIVLGLGIAARAVLRPQFTGGGGLELKLRPTLLIFAAILCFATLMDRAGLLATLFLATAVASLADPRTRLWEAAALGVGLAVFGAAVFVWGLGLPMKLVWW